MLNIEMANNKISCHELQILKPIFHCGLCRAILRYLTQKMVLLRYLTQKSLALAMYSPMSDRMIRQGYAQNENNLNT